MDSNKTGNRHQGRQIKRFREAIGMKQETLARELGTSQQNISYYEKQEELDNTLFNQLANGLGVSPEVLKDFDPDAAVNFISNAYSSYDASIMNSGFLNQPTFNPIDKLMEQASKIEQLYKDLLQSEKDKIEILNNSNKAILDLVNEFKNSKSEKK